MNDLRYALRTLRRSPGFTTVALLTIAIGIGANTAVFSLVNAVLIQPLPYREPERLVAVGHTAPGLGILKAGQSEATFLHYQQHNRVFDAIAVYNENVVNLSGGTGPERVPVAMVTPSFFSILGASPALGRLFSPDDARPDAHQVPVVVLSHGLWRRQFGGDRDIIGRTVRLNEVPREVIGVLNPGLEFPRRTEIWYLSSPNPAAPVVSLLAFSSIARLKRGVSPEAAQTDLNRLIPSITDAYPNASRLLEGARLRAVVTSLRDESVGDVATALWVLLGATGFVLLIACANVANLFLVRAEHRQKEVAVRAALGAARGNLARHALAESVLLAVPGGILGVAMADAVVYVVVAFGPTNIPRLDEARIDGWVWVFAAGLSIVAALALAAIPTLRCSTFNLAAALQEGLRSISGGPRRERARRALVASQVALALALLTGAGLMVRTFRHLSAIDPGFDPHGVLTMELALPATPYHTYQASAHLWYALLERVRALPGVEAAGAVSDLPLRGETMKRYYDTPLDVEGSPGGDEALSTMVGMRFFLPGYIETMRIPMVGGRGLDPQGRADEPTPVLASSALGHRFFRGGVAIGRRLHVRRMPSSQQWNTVVGVVGDVRDGAIQEEPPLLLYVPVLNRSVAETFNPTHMSLVIRARVPPLSLTGAVRAIVHDLDPDLPIANVQPMERIVADSTARTTFTMLLLLIAAVVALFLGAIGIYGVVSYTVTQRTREIGVRVALGARPLDVSCLVVRQGIAITLAGLVVGVLVALGLTRYLGSLLFGVKSSDPVTFATAVILLLVIAVVASYLPARRAARVGPMVALRYE